MVRRRDGFVGSVPSLLTRRSSLLAGGTALGLGLLVRSAGAEPPGKAKAGRGEKPEEKEEDIGPGEDLMREHGVLRRVLLVYDELDRRLERGAPGDTEVAALVKSARIVRRFVEDYHERQEEELVFPRFERAGKLVQLVGVLRVQHRAGRKVTERIQGLADAKALGDVEQRRQLRGALQAFARMYRPHAAREDTVLFPALHDLMSPPAYDALGEDFERREHQLFGHDGFEGAVAEVDAIEKTLGIEDLAKFTP